MKKIISIFIAISIILAITFSALGTDEVIIEYVAGKYGKKCYESGEEHKNIKYKVYFDTLNECKEYIK